MTPTDISVIIGIVTLFLSMGSTALIVGIAWGKMQATMTTMGRDVAEIKGMFRLTPINPKE